MFVFTNPSTWAECDTTSFFKWRLLRLNSEFYFWTGNLTKAKELDLPHFLFTTGGTLTGFITFQSVLELREMPTRICTRVTESICHDDSDYPTAQLYSVYGLLLFTTNKNSFSQLYMLSQAIDNLYYLGIL